MRKTMSSLALIALFPLALVSPACSLIAIGPGNSSEPEDAYTDWTQQILNDLMKQLVPSPPPNTVTPSSVPGSQTNNTRSEENSTPTSPARNQPQPGMNTHGCNKIKGLDYGFKDGGLSGLPEGNSKVPTSTNEDQCGNRTEYNATSSENIRKVTYVWLYGPPVIIVVGTFGNTLSFIVMCRRKIRESTTSLYLRVLAIVDTLVLYTGLFQLWIMHYRSVDIRKMSNFACKFQMFYGYFILQLESWILVTVTLERLCSVLAPASWKSIFSRKNAMLGLWIKVFIGFVVNCHFFFTHVLSNASNATSTTALSCTASGGSKWFMRVVWAWLDMWLASLLPSSIIVLSNVAILSRVLYSRYGGQHTPASSTVQIGTLTKTLVMVSLSFFLTTAPITFYLISAENQLSEEEKAGTTWAGLNMLMYTNNAVNFFIYVIGGTRFRKELAGIFCRTNTVTPTENGS